MPELQTRIICENLKKIRYTAIKIRDLLCEMILGKKEDDLGFDSFLPHWSDSNMTRDTKLPPIDLANVRADRERIKSNLAFLSHAKASGISILDVRWD